MKTLALVLAVALSACQSPPGTQFRATTVQPDGSYPMPVVLGDQTGLVVAIKSAPGDGSARLPSVQPDLGDPKAIIVTWGTGACDDDTGIGLQRSGDRFQMRIAVNSGIDLGCTSQLLARGLWVQFSEAVDADAFDVSGGL